MGRELSRRRNLLAAGAVFIAFAMIATLTYTWQTGNDDPDPSPDDVASSDIAEDVADADNNDIEDFEPEEVEGSEVDDRAESELQDDNLAESSDADVEDPLDADVSVRPSPTDEAGNEQPAATPSKTPPSGQSNNDESATEADLSGTSDGDSGSSPAGSEPATEDNSKRSGEVPSSDDLEDRVAVTRVAATAVANLSPFGVGVDLDIASADRPMEPFMVQVEFDPDQVPSGAMQLTVCSWFCMMVAAPMATRSWNAP